MSRLIDADSLSLSARDVIDEEDVFEIVKAGGLDE